MAQPEPVPGATGGAALDAVQVWDAEYVGVSGRSQVSSRSNTSHVTDTLTTAARLLDVPPDLLGLHQVARDLLVRAVLDYRTRPDRRFTRPTHTACRTRSDASVRRRLSALRAFFTWCVKTVRILTDPTVGIDAPRANRPPPRALTETEARRLLEVATTSFWPERDALLVWFGIGAGLRLSETAGARTDRLLGEPLTHLRVIGKGNRPRDVPLMPPIVAAIEAYLPTRQSMLERWDGQADLDSPWLLLARRPYPLRGVTSIDGQPARTLRLTAYGVSRRVGELMTDAGLREQGRAYHALRHTYATIAMRAGSHNLRELQDSLGHASLSSTQRYTAVTPEELHAASLRHPLAH